MPIPTYWREMPGRYRLEAGKCTKCSAVQFPKRLICPECGNRNFETIILNRYGKVLTYTVIHVAPSQFSDQAPYPVGIIELDEGVKLLAQITDCPLEELRVEMPVKIEFRKISSDGASGIIHYGYKCVPVNNSAAAHP